MVTHAVQTLTMTFKRSRNLEDQILAQEMKVIVKKKSVFPFLSSSLHDWKSQTETRAQPLQYNHAVPVDFILTCLGKREKMDFKPKPR